MCGGRKTNTGDNLVFGKLECCFCVLNKGFIQCFYLSSHLNVKVFCAKFVLLCLYVCLTICKKYIKMDNDFVLFKLQGSVLAALMRMKYIHIRKTM